MEGTIKSIVSDRGFGFIEAVGQPDYFFHVTQLADSLPFDELLKGRRVVFDVSDSPKGPQAVNVEAAI